MPVAYLGLGSNIGARKGYLKAAIRIFDQHKDVHVEKKSAIYETKAHGPKQPNFFNMVVEIQTKLPPVKLMKLCQLIEAVLQRQRDIKWGPRTIDVDILLYNDQEINVENLVIPHPEMKKRDFVLIPLLEIAPHVKLPSGEPVHDLLTHLPADSDIKRVENINS